MDKRKLLIVGGIVVLGLLVVYPLSRMFQSPPAPEVQPSVATVESRPQAPQANDAAGGTVTTAPESQPAVGSDTPEAKPKIIVKTDVSPAAGREVSIGLVLTSATGQPLRVRDVVRAGQPAPKLKIVNEAGQVILDDSFQYG